MLQKSNIESYRAVPYQGLAHRESHPSIIATVAALVGVDAPSPQRARVLEVGCAFGRNLIPMAASLPGARFVGLDLSAHQVDAARHSAQAVGLDNIEFIVGDIAEAGAELGAFDYIIAHGVYSWIPPAARERLMGLCRDLLTPNGVAYISHNVYPGWHRKNALRHMMRYHIRDLEPASRQVVAAKALLEFVSTASSPHDASYKLWLHDEVEALKDAEEWYLFHDHLAVHNDPSYFHEFIEEAHAHGLQFLADAALAANFGHLMPDRLAADLHELTGGDRISFEQHQDFVLNRPFRKTLLCRSGLEVSDRPLPAGWAGAHVLSPYEREDDDAGQPTNTWRKGDSYLRDANPAANAVLEVLSARWPGSISVADLFDIYRGLGVDSSPAAESVAGFCDDLYVLALADVVELSATPVATPAGREHPEVHRWVRQELADGRTSVTSVHHKSAQLSPTLRALAALTDGTRDLVGLVEALQAQVASGAFALPVDDATPEQVLAGLTGGVERGLGQLRHLGLLA
ncbi:MAG: class I SAM-dependent methyltransferase [Myxococcota bacterium]